MLNKYKDIGYTLQRHSTGSDVVCDRLRVAHLLRKVGIVKLQFCFSLLEEISSGFIKVLNELFCLIVVSPPSGWCPCQVVRCCLWFMCLRFKYPIILCPANSLQWTSYSLFIPSISTSRQSTPTFQPSSKSVFITQAQLLQVVNLWSRMSITRPRAPSNDRNQRIIVV